MQIINFGILLFILKRFLYKPLIAMLEKRGKIIKKGLDDAEAAQIKLESAEEKKNKIISDSNQEASEIIEKSKKRGEISGQEIVNNAQNRAESIIKNADLLAQEIQDKTMFETKDKITQTAILAAEKIMKEKLLC